MDKLLNNIKIEVCAYNVESAISAERAGADRIELCDNFQEGGTTPSIGTIKYIKKNLYIDCFVIVRPRGGDFLYTDAEFEVIKEDIKSAIDAGADGIVSGFLLPSGKVNEKRTSEVLEICNSIPFTFHRAFDVTPDPFEALEILKKLGVKRVLTSGQKADVPAGKEAIKKLVKKAEGKIAILPGGGINPKNIMSVIKETGVNEIHLSGKNLFDSGMEFYNPKVSFNSNFKMSENKILKTDQKIISEIITIINAG